MSKFLKFIVHFVIICTIACVLGLALPPFFGIETVIVDSSEKATNLPFGSVTYAIPVKTDEINAGAPILVKKDSQSYRYNIVSIDKGNSTGVVIDPDASAQESINVSIKNWVPKVVITLPFLAYLLVATESTEGMIVLGLAILFLIILYVIAELCKKDPEEDYEYEDAEGGRGRVKTAKELKAEEKARAKRMKEEDRELLNGEKERKRKARKEEKKNRKKIRTGGFVDEIYEDDLDEEPETSEENQSGESVQVATSEAHELLKKEIAAATADESSAPATSVQEKLADVTEEIPDIEESEEEPEIQEKPVEIKKLAIPRYSASQLADKARKAGDTPDIVRDSITKVTLFDYSDIIGGDEETEE
ncbi:hypothetical protein [Blautia sp. HCP28S3_G10]|uniref:hypothetical protein n=1 Tax=Blautia sp. HCP28S3_G10 TaxID=3438908 RepID=UPI003F895749